MTTLAIVVINADRRPRETCFAGRVQIRRNRNARKSIHALTADDHRARRGAHVVNRDVNIDDPVIGALQVDAGAADITGNEQERQCE